MEIKFIQPTKANLFLAIIFLLFFSASQALAAFSDDRFDNTVEKGRFGENVSHDFMRARGYEPLKSHHAGEQGLDGVYVKRDPKTGKIQEVVVVEVKTDSSPYNPDQLSDETIDEQIDKMCSSKDERVRKNGELLKKNRDKIKKEHHQHDTKNGKTTISEIDAKGYKKGEKATFNTKKTQERLLEERQKKKEGKAEVTARRKSHKAQLNSKSLEFNKLKKFNAMKLRPYRREFKPWHLPRPITRPFPMPAPRPNPKIPFIF
jgi:hypothetical protein